MTETRRRYARDLREGVDPIRVYARTPLNTAGFSKRRMARRSARASRHCQTPEPAALVGRVTTLRPHG